jgi:predicted nucleic acid-binding protein
MTDRVIDASALIRLLLPPAGRLAGRHQALTGTYWHTPHLIDAECGNALRRIVRRGELSAVEGRTILRTAAAVIDVRYTHGELTDVAWSLRDRLSFYGALYVALAVRLGVPLVTADQRLATAPGLPCEVELIG